MSINSSLLGALLIFSSLICAAQSIDCRKYIFAPKCRGVSALKRSPVFEPMNAVNMRPHTVDENSPEEEENEVTEQLISDLLKYIPQRTVYELPSKRGVRTKFLGQKSPKINSFSAVKTFEDYDTS